MSLRKTRTQLLALAPSLDYNVLLSDVDLEGYTAGVPLYVYTFKPPPKEVSQVEHKVFKIVSSESKESTVERVRH